MSSLCGRLMTLSCIWAQNHGIRTDPHITGNSAEMEITCSSGPETQSNKSLQRETRCRRRVERWGRDGGTGGGNRREREGREEKTRQTKMKRREELPVVGDRLGQGLSKQDLQGVKTTEERQT